MNELGHWESVPLFPVRSSKLLDILLRIAFMGVQASQLSMVAWGLPTYLTILREGRPSGLCGSGGVSSGGISTSSSGSNTMPWPFSRA